MPDICDSWKFNHTQPGFVAYPGCTLLLKFEMLLTTRIFSFGDASAFIMIKSWCLVFILLTSTTLAAQETGWEANSDIIEASEENRPDFIWRESEVPEYELPDLLKARDGSTVSSPEEWSSRRCEILELFRTHMFGNRPAAPDRLSFHLVEKEDEALENRASMRRISITSTVEDRDHQFELILFLPAEAKKPVPVFLLMNNRDSRNTDPHRGEISEFWPVEEVIRRGYGIAAIQNNELAPDDTDHYHEGVIRLFEGSAAEEERPPDAWGALAAWGWGASRVMDYFETNPDVDESRIALLGHSRGGKASLWAGAEDERFALVISNQSGAGGAALSRRRYGETVEAVNRFEHWFNDHFNAFNDREDELPFDQHMLISLLAPRPVYIGSADADLWADPRGEFLSLVHASGAYELWNYLPVDPEQMPALNTSVNFGHRGYHVRSGSHDLNMTDWHHYMDFADALWLRIGK